MAKEAAVIIDNREVRGLEGTSIIETADRAGIYIPRLCYHPSLPAGPGTKADICVYRNGEVMGSNGAGCKTYYGGCAICVVDILGKGIRAACSTPVADGMVITTNTIELRNMRKDNITRLLANHPHACMLCAEKDGCDRQQCTMGVERDCRCCDKFDNCEFRLLCAHVTVRDDVSQYSSRGIAVVDTQIFTFNAALCIGCTRCVRACETMQGKRVIGFAYHHGSVTVGTLDTTHKKSGCVFCGACVSVCPTGALMDKGLAREKKDSVKLTPVVLPPGNERKLTLENIAAVPEASGVYELLDTKHEVIYIKGTISIRDDILEKFKTVKNACFFRYEEHGMYTMRENEMLEKFLKKYGRLPDVNNEISDLY